MRDTTIEYKVRVFISSSCEGKYTIARKALRTLLMETNVAKAYVFEHGAGSSQPPSDNYLDRLDDSDLCVFLIDNADGVSTGVLKERNRARAGNKKSIYLFCSENKKDPIPLQSELRKEDRETYKVVPLFADLVEEAYHAVMRDIIEIYHAYCANRLVRRPTQDGESGPPTQPVSSYTIDRRLVVGFEKTKGELLRLVDHTEREVPASSSLDKHSSSLVRVLTGQADGTALDFRGLKDCLSAVHHEGPLRDLVLMRVDAISTYLLGDLQRCLDLLHEAYSQTEQEEAIPTWLKNDLLVDARYVELLVDETKSQYGQKTAAQSLLDKSMESVYYPLVDRYDLSLYQRLLDEHRTEMLSSPYSTSFMSYGMDMGNIASAFVTSLLHGSLVHLLEIRQRLTSTLTTFSLIHPHSHITCMELLKLLLLRREDRIIERAMVALNQTARMLNSNDTDHMMSSINTISIPHHCTVSKCLLAKHFGSYMSDSAFDALFNEILSTMNHWIGDPKRMISLGSYLFDAVKTNIYRAGSSEAIRVSLTVLNKGPRRWIDEALGVIRRADPAAISQDVRTALVDSLIAILTDGSLRNTLTGLEPTLAFVHGLVADSPAALDSAVEKYMPDFYTGDYSLSTLSSDSSVRALYHIPRFLESIHTRNEEQGKDGHYYGYMDDPLDTIRRILEHADACPEDGIMKRIIEGIGETLLAPNQTYSTKISAVRLAISLLNRPYSVDSLCLYVEMWLARRDEILRGHRDDFMYKDSGDDLDFGLVMLRVRSGKHGTGELLSCLAAAAERDDYQILGALESIGILCQNPNLSSMNESSLSLICQYVIAMSHHKSVHVRRHTARLLVILCNSPLQLTSLTRLSKMMDEDAFQVKAVILRGLNSMGDESESEMIRYIRQKGAADTHFLVRRLAIQS